MGGCRPPDCPLSSGSPPGGHHSVCVPTNWVTTEYLPVGLPVEEGAGRVDVDHLTVHYRPVALLGVLLGCVAEKPATDGLLDFGCVSTARHDLQLVSEREREREMFYLTTHSTHFIYRYMASDIWLRTILIVRKETCYRHIGYSYRLTARVLLYAPSHRQDNTYHGLCYTSRGALAGTTNSSMGPPHEGSIRRPIAP